MNGAAIDGRAPVVLSIQHDQSRYGFVESIRQVLNNFSWVKMPLVALVHELRAGGIDLSVRENATSNRPYSSYLGVGGTRLPAAAVNRDFARHVESEAARQKISHASTPAELSAAAKFKSAPAIAQYGLDHALTPTKIIEMTQKGVVFNLPYGQADAFDKLSVANLVSELFPNKSYVILNGVGYIAPNNTEANVFSMSKVSLDSTEDDPRFAMVEIAKWVNDYIAAYNKYARDFNRDHPTGPLKTLIQPIDMTDFVRLSRSKANLNQMKAILRRYVVFEESLQPGSTVLMRKADLMRADRVSAWLSAPVVKQVEATKMTSNSVFESRLEAKRRISLQAQALKAEEDLRLALSKSNDKLVVRQRLVPDFSGISSDGGREVLEVVSKENVGEKSSLSVDDLSPGYYDYLNYRGTNVGVVEVSPVGTVSFFNNSGQLHNDIGPAVRYSFGTGKEERYFVGGHPTSRSSVESTLRAELKRMTPKPMPRMPSPKPPFHIERP